MMNRELAGTGLQDDGKTYVDNVGVVYVKAQLFVTGHALNPVIPERTTFSEEVDECSWCFALVRSDKVTAHTATHPSTVSAP